jgi:hypothetical protein
LSGKAATAKNGVQYVRARTYLFERRGGAPKIERVIPALPLLGSKSIAPVAVQTTGFQEEIDSLQRDIAPGAEDDI